MTAQVYRAFDGSGRLLYVGCSVDVDGRLLTHAEHSTWWPFHTTVTREDFPTRELAGEAEILAIQTEHPRWNMHHRAADHPDGFCHTIDGAPWLHYERDVWRRWKRATTTARELAAEKRENDMALRTASLEIAHLKAGHLEVATP